MLYRPRLDCRSTRCAGSRRPRRWRVDALLALRRVNTIAILMLAAGMPMLLDCNQIPLRVDLSPGYSGMVTVSCTRTSIDPHRVTVDSTGHGEITPCPEHLVNLVIMRGGKSISAEGPISWDPTGDGIIVGFHFSSGPIYLFLARHAFVEHIFRDYDSKI